jgi:RimJ/RimL family protein N-acetyltransferase
MVGLHILRRFEEWEQVGVHIAGLWVDEEYRGRGIARELKRRGEDWARSVGATFVNTNVQSQNERMLAINERAGFSVFRYNLRKRL